MKWNQAVIAIMLPLVFPSLVFAQESLNQTTLHPNLYMTPLSSYSRYGKSLAITRQPELMYMLDRIQREIQSSRFEILDLNQAPKAGLGFWSNPNVLAPEVRFLGLAVKVNIRLTYFPDSDQGRLADALDAFGKDLIKIMGDTLELIPEPSVKGIVLVLIYSKSELKDPAFYDKAEAYVIYISRTDLKKFNSFQITLHKLFENVDCYYFNGKDQINVLLNYFLRG